MTSDDAGLAAMSDSHLFHTLDETDRQKLLQGASTVTFATGKIIVREGDPGDALFIVKSGRVKVTTTLGDKPVILASLERGACFGEVAVLRGKPRTATIVAEEESSLLRFSKQQIEELLSHNPQIRKRLEAVIIGRAKDTIEKIRV